MASFYRKTKGQCPEPLTFCVLDNFLVTLCDSHLSMWWTEVWFTVWIDPFYNQYTRIIKNLLYGSQKNGFVS
jgi:hypothetical protein